eukprot:TRINITY_DN32251_c0_g1_i1.p1 TRINITY_DN32251_c0_g1~~TRINITY_DN32251_c0_g1_i1.p1  ORF type:complete len:363 (-),score=58.63 TRINITY_DN32251_c0_g1_i1:58-1101(-)
MKFSFSCIFILLVFLNYAYGGNSEVLDEKIDEDGLLVLNTEQYAKFVLSGPRKYDVLLFFYTTHPEHGCQQCEESYNRFVQFSKGYKAKKEQDSSIKQVYFMAFDYSEEFAFVFGIHELQTAPVLACIRSDKGRYKYDVKKPSPFALSAQWIPTQEVPLLDEEEFEVFIQDELDLELKALPLAEERAFFALVGTILCATVVPLILFHLNTIKSLYKNKWFFYSCSLLVFVLSTGGAIHCILNQVHVMTVSPHEKKWANRIGFFSQNPRSQTIVEGLTIVFLYLVCGSSLIGIVRAAKFESKFSRTVIFCACLAAMALSITFIVESYVEKMGFYQLDALFQQLWYNNE